MVGVLRRPTPTAAVEAIEEHLSGGTAVAIIGECLLQGGGASAGDLGTPAVRHVLVKPDGAVVVHGGTGVAPARAIAAGDDFSASADGEMLRIQAGDPAMIDVSRVDFLAGAMLDDAPGEGGDDVGSGAHASLRDRLLAEPDLVEPGFRPLSTERETSAGPVDVYGRDADGRAVVVEVKAHRAGPGAVGQLDRYVDALGSDLHAQAEVRGVLVAPSATARTRTLLEERGYAFRPVSVGR